MRNCGCASTLTAELPEARRKGESPVGDQMRCYNCGSSTVEATRKICNEVKEGSMKLEDVDEDVFEKQLSICGSRPPVDLVIRFGGHKRIGMLLGWQVPHTELYFTDIHAPDFGDNVFLDAIRSFQQRARWFGK
ncbi:Ditrans polycis-undecaprenyl-diphosphate synthase ((2E 6E)-farnesyl-diphosphate specific) [Bienertia sinuspersici]